MGFFNFLGKFLIPANADDIITDEEWCSYTEQGAEMVNMLDDNEIDDIVSIYSGGNDE